MTVLSVRWESPFLDMDTTGTGYRKANGELEKQFFCECLGGFFTEFGAYVYLNL